MDAVEQEQQQGHEQGLRTMADLPFVAAAAQRDRAALRAKRDGQWTDVSFEELAGTVRDLALGLIDAGLAPGDRVCVLAETRPEWTYAGLAVIAAGGIVVPIYPTSSVEECAWVAGNSGATMLISENAAQLAKITQVRDRLPQLRSTVLIDSDGAGTTLAELIERGRAAADPAELDRRRDGVGVDDPSIIIYTSGTTGPPKGCVITHRNWLALCNLIAELGHVSADDVVYLFLPLAHVFAQLVQFGALYSGATLAYVGGDVRQVVPELAEVRPTFLPSVPRIFEKVYTLMTAAVPGPVLEQWVRAGLEVRECERLGRPVPADTQATFEAAQVLFGKVRAVFGGRLRQALSGAAPISPAVLEFFLAAGVPVLEGYGMSETAGIGTVNTLENFRLGRVGVAAPGVRLRLADDGEVLMSGPHVFAGYWADAEATARTVVDGWIHTGDLGEIDEDGFLAITGRKKDIIITAAGKNIAPANLENELRQSRWISHAVMFGDGRPYPVALLTLDPEEIGGWARERGLPADPAELTRHPEVLALVQQVVDEVNAGYARPLQIKKFVLLDRDLSAEAGELTPTLKVKRNVVYANHGELFVSMYEPVDRPAPA